MFNSTILDLVIGMIFVYLLLSLMCSAANEIIELHLKNRAVDLERGIRELLNDRDRASGIVEAIYKHPLVNGLFEKSYNPDRLTKWRRFLGHVNLPSYIPARNFALALMDTKLVSAKEGEGQSEAKATPAQGLPSGASGATPPSSAGAQFVVNVQPPAPQPPPNPNVVPTLRENIETFPDDVKRALTALVDAAGNDAAKARENIENWYNSSMDRVSGWYKRRSQVFVLIIGFMVAIALNADSIVIAKKLWSDKPLRDSLVAAADAYAKANANATVRPSPTPTSTPTPTSNTAPSSKPASPAGTAAKPTPTPPPNSDSTKTVSTESREGTSGTKAAASPTPCLPKECEGKLDSDDCRKKAIACQQEDCWRDACPQGKDDPSAQCKLVKNKCAIDELGLPIGWSLEEWPGLHFWTGPFWTGWGAQFRIHILGWLLTALAISLGAPFWFDMLNKFIVVRATVKPKEKSPEERSKD